MARGKRIEGGLDGLKALQNISSKNNSQTNTKQSQEYKVKDSFDISKTQVPKDTREALKDFKEIDNFYLKLNQFARFEEGKLLFFKSTKGKVDFSITPNFGNFPFEENIIKQEASIKALFGKNYHEKELKTSYRLVIGGEATVYETSMRLHHIYGIPYIPASGIKGVVRSYIITEKFEEQLKKYDKYSDFEEKVLFAKDEKGEYKEKGFVDVFGSQEQEGKVTFFDAFPIAKPTLKVDIMNPHYGDYYSKKIAPTDTMKLNPIPFLTVENTKFGFLIGAKEELETFSIKGKKIEDWLSEALKNHGLGAKTAVGYGYF
jgi:CRISPR-associated protein Cmr6